MSFPKRILVVGGGNGIGWATVRQLLADTDAEVIVADCDKTRIDELRNQTELRKFAVLDMDLTDLQSVSKAIDFMIRHFVKVDVLIISAAIHTCYPIECLTDVMIDRVLNVNLISQIKFIKNILPNINNGGHIIGISSIAAGIGVPMESLYSASKAGLETFFECLSVEISHRQIHVSIMHPGNVNTGFNEKGNDYQSTGHSFIDEGYKRVVSGIDSSMGIPPESVARLIIRVLQSKKPKFFHAVGLNAKKAYWAKRLLGKNLAVKLMAKHFGF